MLLPALTLWSGCGWRRGMVLPDGARTVGVEIFRTERQVYERGLEAAFHRELSRAVSDLIQAPLVAPEDADLVVRGSIGTYRRRSGIRSRGNRLRETGVQIEISAELVDRATRRASPGSGLGGTGLGSGSGASRGPSANPNDAVLDADELGAAAVRAGALSSAAGSDAAPRAFTAHVWSGYGLDDPTNESSAAARSLRYLAQTMVLELFVQEAGRSGTDLEEDLRDDLALRSSGATPGPGDDGTGARFDGD